MFGMKKRGYEPDDAQRLLDSVKSAEQSAPADPDGDDRTLTQISAEDARTHCDIMNMIVLAFVIVFFGTGFLALTNYQDFTDDEPFSAEAFVSGKYLSQLEKDFNGSIPLRDHLHNANEFIGLSFGLENTADYIDTRPVADDPDSIVGDNGFIPISDSRGSGEAYNDPEQTTLVNHNDVTTTETEDNGKKKKLSGIIMTTSSPKKSTSASSTTTTNTREPGATSTTTIPPVTTTTTAAYEEPATTPSETEPPDISEPDDTTSDELPEDQEIYRN